MERLRSSPSNASDAPSARFWTLSGIRELAEREFPNDFQAIPSVRNLTFKSRDINDEVPERSHQLCIDTAMSLAVGHYDIGAEKLPVFVFLRVFYGQRVPQIIYVCCPDNRTERLHLFGGEMSSVKFEVPFCDLDNDTAPSYVINGRLRAVILYYFLQAGHLQHFPRYSSFLQLFQQGCMSINRCITMSKANPAVSHQGSKQIPSATTSPSGKRSVATRNVRILTSARRKSSNRSTA